MNTIDRMRNKCLLFTESSKNSIMDSQTINHPVKYSYLASEEQMILLADPSYANKIFLYHIIGNRSSNDNRNY